jgi:hypothetical protein
MIRISLRTVFRLAAVLGVLDSAAVAHAQTGACPTSTALTVNPNGWVCVTPAPDYGATTLAPDGVTIVPAVVRLDLLLFAPGVDTATGTPSNTVNLGKPAANQQGAVWAQVAQVTAIPKGQQWKARVVSVGQPLTAGGAAQVSPRSPESNPFLAAQPPAAPLAPLGVHVPGS